MMGHLLGRPNPVSYPQLYVTNLAIQATETIKFDLISSAAHHLQVQVRFDSSLVIR